MSYFLQPCYVSKGRICWTSVFSDADFFSVYSGEPWGSYQFLGGYQTPWEGLQEIQRLLNVEHFGEVATDLAPPFPANPMLGEINDQTGSV